MHGQHARQAVGTTTVEAQAACRWRIQGGGGEAGGLAGVGSRGTADVLAAAVEESRGGAACQVSRSRVKAQCVCAVRPLP